MNMKVSTMTSINGLSKKVLQRLLGKKGQVGTTNLIDRERWLEQTLKKIPSGCRILDAGAGELKYKKFCQHLNYVSQDFAQYDGKGDGAGLHRKNWDQSRLDIV